MKSVPLFLAMLALSGCSLLGISSIEEPEFNVVAGEANFEIRDYAPMMVVETKVSGDYDDASSQAFRRLFRYISGSNSSSEKIEMTAPVEMKNVDLSIMEDGTYFQEQTKDGWSMSFVLPSSFTKENTPQPEDSNVVLREIPGKTIAVKKFTGRWRMETFNTKSDQLIAWLSENGYELRSAPRIAVFDPPWTISFLRRNEVHIDVHPSSTK